MKFENAIKVSSESKQIVLYVDTGVSYGDLHDFLMNVKGIVVDRINQAHAEEKAAIEKVKEADAKKLEDTEISEKVEEIAEIPKETIINKT